MKIDGSAVRMGMVIEWQEKLWLVVKHEIRTPGNLRSFNQVELKDIKSGTKNTPRFASDEKIERVSLDSKKCNFLYADGEELHFMDNDNYEQFTISKEMIGPGVAFLQEGMTVDVEAYEGTPLSVALPPRVAMKIVEADPVVRGQTAASSYKPAILENGVRVMVPPFIPAGETIIVNTATLEYVERAKGIVMNTPLINLMSAAAIKAGKGLLRDFGEVSELQVSRKGPANFVTKSDIRTEKLLQRELSAVRPDFGFLMEEGGEIQGKDASQRWIIDPIDGTTNFIHAIPYFCISIGLEKRTGSTSEIIAGVIYDPIHNEVFAAEKNKGAFVNGKRMTVSSRATPGDALLVTGKMGMPNTEELIQAGTTVRCFGAIALDLANLASGRIDACCYSTMKPWDIAAGLLLVQEAGGQFSTMDGKPADSYSHTLLATNKHLQSPVQKLLQSAA